MGFLARFSDRERRVVVGMYAYYSSASSIKLSSDS